MMSFDALRFVAGLGLFLFGMQMLEDALKTLSSESFRNLLRRSTSTPVLSVLGGTVTTMILQSSSMVGLMMLAFVGAGIIPLYNAVGVVLGANLGTTITGWIVTMLGFKLKLDALAIPLMGLGAFWHVLAGKRDRWKAWGGCVLGLGLILYGLDAMKTAMEQVALQADVSILQGYPLLVYVLVGAVFTALIRSSSGAMMIIISALHAGSVDLAAAAALAVGSNLGTTSTMALGSIKGAAVKKQLALAHVLFNVVASSLAFLLLHPLLDFVRNVLGATDPLYALVAFHSVFNGVSVLLFLPFVKPFAVFLERLIVDKSTDVRTYINNVPYTEVNEAILAANKEVQALLVRVAALNFRNLKTDVNQLPLPPEARARLQAALPAERTFPECYDDIKILEGKILEYAGQVQTQVLTPEQVTGLLNLLNAARHGVYAAKSLKDIRENLVNLRHTDKPELDRFYSEQEQNEVAQLVVLFQLLQESPETEQVRQQLVQIRADNKQFHRDVERKLFMTSRALGVNEWQASTLLNINRGFRSSVQSFARALSLLLPPPPPSPDSQPPSEPDMPVPETPPAAPAPTPEASQ